MCNDLMKYSVSVSTEMQVLVLDSFLCIAIDATLVLSIAGSFLLHDVALRGESSPESSCRLLLGGLLHFPSEATTVRLYICPHWSSGSSQLVKFELQVETWPLGDRAVAV